MAQNQSLDLPYAVPLHLPPHLTASIAPLMQLKSLEQNTRVCRWCLQSDSFSFHAQVFTHPSELSGNLDVVVMSDELHKVTSLLHTGSLPIPATDKTANSRCYCEWEKIESMHLNIFALVDFLWWCSPSILKTFITEVHLRMFGLAHE